MTDMLVKLQNKKKACYILVRYRGKKEEEGYIKF